MKIKNLFGWLGLSALMLTTACVRDDIAAEQSNENLADVYGTGSKVVTLTINAATVTGTRVDDEDDVLHHISDGSYAHLLRFEVYDLGDGNSETAKAIKVVDPKVYEPAVAAADGDWWNKIDDENYVSVYIPNTEKTVTTFPVNIRLAVDPDHNYKVAFWAQHEYTTGDPFDFDTTKGLTKVTVDYEGALNNDELRDAFCANLFIGKGEKTNEVVLHRPFAQLNVGTTGADYKNYMQGNILPNRTITHSKMVITGGVYNTINVADDVISGEVEGKVELSLAKIPAFINYKTSPFFPDNLLGTWVDGEDDDDGEYVKNDKEEFLRVNLNNPTDANAELKDYVTEYPTIAEDGSYNTETFKYMSMAYVLVANGNGYYPNEESNFQNDKNDYDKYKSSTLGSVEVWFAEGAQTDNKYTGEAKDNGYKYFTVNNVPVHRNWRTNLLGGLSNTDPDDPNDPDDDTSLFFNTKIHVHLCPIYFGEYNGKNTPEAEGDGFDGIFSDYFPTGDNDLHDGYHDDQQPAEDDDDDDDDQQL